MKTKIIISTLGVFALFISYLHTESAHAPEIEKGMIKVTLLYPSGEGSTFDMDYYADKHMPMVAELLGKSLKSFAIDKGIGGRVPGEPAPYMAIGYLYFDKLSDYQTAFGPVAQKIVGDIPNYTNVQPVLQISEVIK
ncbi:MAG: hypothetical protein Roseis2KO_27020 [Roseivirga sp.]